MTHFLSQVLCQVEKIGNLPLLEAFLPFYPSHDYEESSTDQSHKVYSSEYSSSSTTFNTLILFPAGQSEYVLQGREISLHLVGLF